MYELRVGRRKATQWTRLTWVSGKRSDIARPYGQTRLVHQGKPDVGTPGKWIQLPAGRWVWLDFRDRVGLLTSVTEDEYEAVKRGQ